MEKEIYIKLPDSVETGEPAEMGLLNLPFGTKQAGRLWGIKLSDGLEQTEATLSTVDPCLNEWHTSEQGRFFILLYVEDIVEVGESFHGVDSIKSGVSSNFRRARHERGRRLIGMKGMHDKRANKLTLSNTGLIMALIQAFGMDTCTPNKTAMASGVKLSKTGENLLPDGDLYAELVGSLLHLSKTTKPDIGIAVGMLSGFMSCSERDRMSAAKRGLRYLRGTTRRDVMYGGNGALEEYVDSD